VVQPTIVDKQVFQHHWVPEAFDLWKNHWISLVEPATPTAAFLGKCGEKSGIVYLGLEDCFAHFRCF
jgi:hypothetical protein